MGRFELVEALKLLHSSLKDCVKWPYGLYHAYEVLFLYSGGFHLLPSECLDNVKIKVMQAFSDTALVRHPWNACNISRIQNFTFTLCRLAWKTWKEPEHREHDVIESLWFRRLQVFLYKVFELSQQAFLKYTSTSCSGSHFRILFILISMSASRSLALLSTHCLSFDETNLSALQ